MDRLAHWMLRFLSHDVRRKASCTLSSLRRAWSQVPASWEWDCTEPGLFCPSCPGLLYLIFILSRLCWTQISEYKPFKINAILQWFFHKRWVFHWLHAGQLTIKVLITPSLSPPNVKSWEGLKMSKSLKNYTSIQVQCISMSLRFRWITLSW